ncbi:MAG: siderophore-interacting protein [Polyangiaceae bacterium]
MSLVDSMNPNVLFGRVLGPLLFRKAQIVAAADLSSHFRSLDLAGGDLCGTSSEPGDKVQVFLGSGGMRTYSPIGWDSSAGTMKLVVYIHGDGPGATFGKRAAPGDEVQFFGPRRSLSLSGSGSLPLIFFGDESSIGVLCAATKAKAPAFSVLEVTDEAEVASVLQALGIRAVLCVKKEPSDHHMPRVASAIRERLTGEPRAHLMMTGRAQSIQALRGLLKVTGPIPPGKTKAYWSVGKRGLD